MVPTYFCPWILNLHIAIVLLRLRVHYSVEIKRHKSQIRIRMHDGENEFTTSFLGAVSLDGGGLTAAH